MKRFILCGVLFGLCQSGTFNNNETFTLGNVTDLVKLTTLNPASFFDDFVVVSLLEFGTMYGKGLITYRAVVQGRLWYEDKNGTKYTLAIQMTAEEKEKELEDKLNNYTGDGLICVGEVCLPPDLAKKYLDDIRAKREGRLLALHVAPFSVMVSVFIIVAFVGVSGNTLIIIGVGRSSSLRNSTTVFLCSLAAADIIVLIVCLPMQVLERFYSTGRTLVIPLCKFMHWTKYFSMMSSISIMSSMAVERYIAIRHPLKAKSLCTVRNALIAVVIVWTISTSICIPVIFFTGSNDGSCRLAFKTQRDSVLFNCAVFTVVFLIPLGFMGPLYSKIFYVLWKSGKKSQKLQSSQNDKEKIGQDNSTTRTRKKVIKMLGILLILFFLSWGPPVALDFIDSVRVLQPGVHSVWPWKTIVSTVFDSLGICNSALNPIVYICMSKQFRIRLKAMFQGCCGRMKDPDEHSSRTESAVSRKTMSSHT